MVETADSLRAQLTAERDASAAREAQLVRERDASVAREVQLLARLRLSEGSSADAAAATGVPYILARAPSLPLQKLPSPSETKGTRIIDSTLCVLVERPLAASMLQIMPPAPSVTAAFRALLDGFSDSRTLSKEGPFYTLASRFLPSGAESVGDPVGDMEAASLFSPSGLLTRSWAFAAKCLPELHVRGAVSAERPYRPAFNGEITSISATWLDQAVYYTAMDLVRIFFPASADGRAPGRRRFFSKPPVGFAIVAFPHVGYLVALEWIGALFVSPVSAPFFLGGAEHQAAVAALPDVDYEPPLELDEALVWRAAAPATASATALAHPPPQQAPAAASATAQTPPPPVSVAWSISGGRFYKLLLANARSPRRQRALNAVYERLAQLHTDAAATAPSALEPIKRGVRLLYGAHEVLVDMPALADASEMSDAEVTTRGSALAAVAAGIAWLASRGILYVDLRGPNVISGGGAVWLVDYDDCIVVAQPVRSLGAFLAELVANNAAAEVDFASALCRDQLPEVTVALDNAFQELQRGEALGTAA